MVRDCVRGRGMCWVSCRGRGWVRYMSREWVRGQECITSMGNGLG